MPSEFLKQMDIVGKQSILGGTIRQAASFAMSKRMEATSAVVHRVNDRLRLMEDQDLQTAEERIGILSGDEEVVDSVQGIKDAAVQYQKLDTRIRARQAEYEKVYGEAFQTLGLVGGQEAADASAILEGRLKSKVGKLSKELEAPIRQIQFQAAYSNYVVDKMKMEELMNDVALRNQATQVSEYILGLNEYYDIPEGHLKLMSGASLTAYNKRVGIVKALARENFGEESGITPRGIEAGYKMASDYSGRSMQYQEHVPKGVTPTGYTETDKLNAIYTLKHWSGLWTGLRPEVKQAIGLAIEGVDVEDVVLPNGETVDKAIIRNYSEVFGAGVKPNDPNSGVYMKALGVLQATDGPGLGFDKGQWMGKVGNPNYSDIYLPSSALGFAKNGWYNNPEAIVREGEAKGKELAEQGLETTASNFTFELYGDIIGDPTTELGGISHEFFGSIENTLQAISEGLNYEFGLDIIPRRTALTKSERDKLKLAEGGN